MSSNMTEVNEGFIQYPVPGVDNDSQGFRDRYSIIRTNLNTARAELSQLITNTAKVNTNNNFGGNKIIDANLNSTTLEANTAEANVPITNDDLSISWAGGSVHVIQVGNSANPLTLSFTNWPDTNRFAKITLIVSASTDLQGSRTIAWPSNVKINFNISESSISTAMSEPVKIFEVFTYNEGATLFVNYLGVYE
jgi:hypothetical protein